VELARDELNREFLPEENGSAQENAKEHFRNEVDGSVTPI
jgi:hypothetical protein